MHVSYIGRVVSWLPAAVVCMYMSAVCCTSQDDQLQLIFHSLHASNEQRRAGAIIHSQLRGPGRLNKEHKLRQTSTASIPVRRQQGAPTHHNSHGYSSKSDREKEVPIHSSPFQLVASRSAPHDEARIPSSVISTGRVLGIPAWAQ